MLNENEMFEKAFKIHLEGKIKEAQKIYLKLVKKTEKKHNLFFLLATTYLQTEDYEKAINFFNKSIDIKSNFADAYNNRGIALYKLKMYHESIEDFNRAIELKDNYFDAHLNKGISLRNLKKYDEAIQSYQNCIKLKSHDAKIYNNLANVFVELGNYDKALKSFNKAIHLNKEYAEAYFGRGKLFSINKHPKLAIKDFENTIKIKDDFDFLYGHLIHTKMRICDWSNYESLIKKVVNGVKINKKMIDPFCILSLIDDPKKHRITSELSFNKQTELPSSIKNFSQLNKIKIGYFSGDLCDHAFLHLTLDIFKHHDKSKFEVYAFYSGLKEDKWTEKAKGYFDKFFNVSNLNGEEIANLSRKNQIDIAINCSGHTGYNQNEAFNCRVSSIQVNYLGYPGTMGDECHDYIIADKFVLPKEEASNYTEKILYLPNCYQANRSKIPIADSTLSKKDFGLPEGFFVFGCFNNSYKINPEIFDIWMKILKKNKNSVLWLLNTDDCSKNLIKEAIKKKINPNRIIFCERASVEIYHSRFKFIDLFLDTYPYSAHTTASIAIRMGVPIITISGRSFASRVAGSILSTVGLNELITKNSKEYIELALKISKDENKFKKLKSHLSNSLNTDKLFNSKKFTRDLEDIFINLINKKAK